MIYRAIVIAAALLAIAAVLGAPLWLLIPAGVLVAVAVRLEELAPRPAHVRYRPTRNRPPCKCRACGTLEAQVARERAIALATHTVVDNRIRRSQMFAIRGWNEERYRLAPLKLSSSHLRLDDDSVSRWLRAVEAAHLAAALYVSVGGFSRMLDAMQDAWDGMAKDLGL